MPCPCCRREEISLGVDECPQCGFPLKTSGQITGVLFLLAFFAVTFGAAEYWSYYAQTLSPEEQAVIREEQATRVANVYARIDAENKKILRVRRTVETPGSN